MRKSDFKWDGRFIQLIELLIDLSIVFFGLFIVIYIYDEMNNITFGSVFENIRELALTNVIMLFLVFIFFRIYRTSITKNGFITVIPKIFIALLMTNIVTVFVSLFMSKLEFSKTLFLYSFLIQFSLLFIFKFAFYHFFKRVNKKTAIIIGPSDQADKLAVKLLSDAESYTVLKYIIYDDDGDQNQLSTIYEYMDLVDYVYLTPNVYEKKKNAIISHCLDKNKTFFLVPKIYELAIINSKLNQIGDVMAYEIKGLEMSLEDRFIKRSFDIFVSVVGIILTSPILIFMTILIKLSDGGPVLFKQERLTANNKKFTLVKFRTMIPDAEKHTGPVLASENDPRITKLGLFMRKTRIDELPQFFNILKGEMSIVGPRPEREFFVEQFVKENPNYKYRLNVKAGVTGLAQSLGKYNTTFEDKLRFDLYYIRNYSFLEDIKILLYTIRTVFDSDSTQGLRQKDQDIFEFYGYVNIAKDDNDNIRFIVNK